MDKSAATTARSSRKPGRKQRIPLSCEPCRSRKLKCNREQPCQNCTVRDNPKGCLYIGSEGGPASSLKPMEIEGMQTRIDRLEQLVTSLVTRGQDPSGTVSSYVNSGSSDASSSDHDFSVFRAPSATERHTPPYDGIEHGIGVMKVDGNASMYKGTTHWYDVLQELNEIKSFWSQVQENPSLSLEPSYSDIIDGPSLFFGVSQPTSMPELLSSLPSRSAAEKLLTRFFDNEEGPAPTFHILHKPTFMRQYHEHLAAPNKTPIMWLGLFFAVLSQIMISYHLNSDEPPEYEGISASMSQLYRVKATQCLAMGDISSCKPYTVETLVYSIMCEWARIGQSDMRVWLMVGLLVRVAFQMGYHRDPSQYPEITVFQGEMRRRVWYFVHRTDALTSFLVGQPCAVRENSHDTHPPSNLYDWELSEDMTENPPSRPISEPTPVSYLIIKGNILLVAGKAVNFLSDVGQSYPYDKVLELDAELEEVFINLPPFFKLQSFDDVEHESPSLVNRRIQLEFLYHQAMCVLHRKFFTQGRLDPRFKKSYTRCKESALALLAEQHFLYTQAMKGSLIARHWYRVSYTSHSYILAAMILVLDIRHQSMDPGSEGSGLILTLPADIVAAIQKAGVIWKQKSDDKDSAEAVKVYQVLSNMLSTLGLSEKVEMTKPEKAMAEPDITLAQQEMDTAFVPALDMDIDWDVWNSYVEGASFDDAYGNPQNFELV